jgi:calreticulin
MHGETPYNVMFGPDICGPGTRKVHVILSYKGDNKQVKKTIPCKYDEGSHLYTLILKKDNSYEVQIDGEKVESGNIEEDFSMLPAKTIKDPAVSKPADWVDEAKMADPEDTKPADWDTPEHIADPEAEKPEDWDDEMDGEWEAPMIPNPEYKGEWKPKMIDNPEYKGEWVHPEIANPEYEANSELYAYPSFGAIGFDLWQVKSGTIFDAVLLTDEASKYDEAVKAFKTRKEGEEAAKKAAEEAEKAAKKAAEEAEAAKAAETEAADATEDDEEVDEDIKDEL